MLGEVALNANTPADAWGGNEVPSLCTAGAKIGEASVMFSKIDNDQIATEMERLNASTPAEA